MAVVTYQTVEQLQQQYGTLRRAVEFYLDQRMPQEQMAALERVVAPEFIHAVAQTRLLTALVDVVRRNQLS